MSRPPTLSPDEVAAALRQRDPEWSLTDEGTLHRSLEFANFAAAFGFMTEVAIHAEKANHHPNWSNVYNRVEIDLVTHDVGGITQLDLDLATVIDEAARRSTP